MSKRALERSFITPLNETCLRPAAFIDLQTLDKWWWCSGLHRRLRVLPVCARAHVASKLLWIV